MNRKHISTLLWIFIALLALLGTGALKKRADFMTRGIPDGLPQPISDGGARLGVNVALNQYDDAALNATLTAITNHHIQYVKQSFYFAEPFDWEEADRLITAVSTHNLTLVPLLDGNPDNQFAPPLETVRFASWAAQFAQRYGDDIQHYIIWDEPNITSHWGNMPVNPVEYGALLTAVSTQIRANDPDALIIAAPLAPTSETGPMNLSESLFLDSLYESGVRDAFDIIAAKPYGFHTSPDDRTVAENSLNFSRAILLRETMLRHNDGGKAIWSGNWGWNSLPDGWSGAPSIWGATDSATQAKWTIDAFNRAQQEWPWMGIMFLENWEPDVLADAPANDPRWGFSVAGEETAVSIQNHLSTPQTAAMPGFHLAIPDDPAQAYEGGWRFSPEFGADISETGEGEPADRVTFTFWGTDVGLRVRRANYRARLYVTVDGRSANALPKDENGSTLILTAPDKSEDYVATEWVARDLPLGYHTVEITAERGWDQWALNGFAVAAHPSTKNLKWQLSILAGIAIFSALSAMRIGRQADWASLGQSFGAVYGRFNEARQLTITAVIAAIVALTGWLTWGEQAAGIYRRLGDSSQLAITAAAAATFYITPTFFIYLAALGLLFLLTYFRPVWGVALIAFCFPFSVPPLLKPILNYRFSPTEIFTLLTFAAFLLRQLAGLVAKYKNTRHVVPSGTRNLSPSREGRFLSKKRFGMTSADYAVLAFTAVSTLSLFFTQRVDVASNEWRVVILEPALFYLVLRGSKPSKREMGTILNAFILSGVVVAGFGAWQYLTGTQLITAEGGLLRIRSFYGSPNNVGLYLGRVLPLFAAMLLFSKDRNWRWGGKTAVFFIMGIITLLTFSRGAILLGLPAAFLFIFWRWQQINGRKTWPWLLGLAVLGIGTFVAALQIPQLAGRLNLSGQTSFFRLNLWQASLNMFLDHPIWGVGLDNFLYAYRGRYILNAAWKDPNLSHPHNIWLDFGTRLGMLGLLTGGWMIFVCGQLLWKLASQRNELQWIGIGLAAGLLDMLAHGLVDHSFFLVDLSFVFYLMLGTAVTLINNQQLTIND